VAPRDVHRELEWSDSQEEGGEGIHAPLQVSEEALRHYLGTPLVLSRYPADLFVLLLDPAEGRSDSSPDVAVDADEASQHLCALSGDWYLHVRESLERLLFLRWDLETLWSPPKD